MDETTPKPKKKRKTSVKAHRGSRAKVKRPKASNRLKELWADPEWRAAIRAKQIAAGFAAPGVSQQNRAGVPDGMRKPEAMKAWAKAEKSARKTVAEIKKHTNLLGEDDGKAEEALVEALKIMRGPSTSQTLKLSAARLVLDFTKAKPASKSIVAVDDAEAWLTKITEESDADEGEAA